MAYKLTLTKGERDAIDWVGRRYSNGDALRRLLLWVESSQAADDASWEGDVNWDDEVGITFTVPEHIAWQIRDNAEMEDSPWPCFADGLASKMQHFVDDIV